jgi:hypothetical protein
LAQLPSSILQQTARAKKIALPIRQGEGEERQGYQKDRPEGASSCVDSRILRAGRSPRCEPVHTGSEIFSRSFRIAFLPVAHRLSVTRSAPRDRMRW